LFVVYTDKPHYSPYFLHHLFHSRLLSANQIHTFLLTKFLHYGEGYEIFLREPIDNFIWHGAPDRKDTYRKPDPETFVADKKADYEVIDVIDIDPSITEIGVFEGENCIGSVVVESDKEQILTYSTSSNRDNTILTFQVASGRGNIQDVLTYKILSTDGTKAQSDVLISGRQDYSILQFGELGNQDTPDALITDVLNPNYPNPFNPETKISFQLAEKSDITLSIYNTKGQKVKTLLKGKYESGLQTIIWNGTDDEENKVSSGVYLYKLQTNNETLTHKMLLMK